MTKVVALDIGHGADTYELKRSKFVIRDGKVYEEHDFNCDVTMRTKALLEAHGITVWLPQAPHGTDRSLKSRTDEANRRGVDLYWSTHANAGKSSVSGVCAFYWHTAKEAKELAERFARNAEAAGFDTHGNGTHASEPGEWTEMHVCRETNMTAVLTENGFMTNAKDFEGIFGRDKESYRQRVAEVHAKTICEFFGVTFNKPVVVETQSKEDEDMLEKAIVINAFPDFPFAEILAARINAPIYTRAALPAGKIAKEVYVVGGTKDGLKADKFVMLTGADRFEVARKVEDYLK